MVHERFRKVNTKGRWPNQAIDYDVSLMVRATGRSLFLGGLVNQFLFVQVPEFTAAVTHHRLGPQLFANGMDAGPIGLGTTHGPKPPPTSGIAQILSFVDGACKYTLPRDIDDALPVRRAITVIGASKERLDA